MLTERQKGVLDYIQNEQREKGLTPSTREIQKHFGFASQTSVMQYLDALERLWYDATPEHHGQFVDFAGIDAYPRPVQDRIPIIVGGHAKASLRRAVTRGHGWYGFMTTPDSTARCLDALREAATRFERPASLGPLEITVTPYGPFTRGAASAYRDLGVDRVVPWHIDWERFPGDAVPPRDWRGVEAAIDADLRALD